MTQIQAVMPAEAGIQVGLGGARALDSRFSAGMTSGSSPELAGKALHYGCRITVGRAVCADRETHEHNQRTN